MLKLNNITLICADTVNPAAAIASMQKSMSKVKFAKCVLCTNVDVQVDGIDIVLIPTLNSKEDYSKFIIFELYKHFNTDYCLIVQHDSSVLFPEAWQDEFLNYDVLGAAWLYTDGRNVGNGGFSLRSKRLQTILGTDPNIKMYSPEDEVIGRLYRQYLEETHGIKYPTDDVADEFAFELREPRCKTFGFHSYFHQPYIPTIVFKRSAALGDCLIAEPLFRHFATLGYNIVLDIPIDYFDLFKQHYFPIKHISQFDSGRIKPERVINLDLAYEVKPRQNYLKSYFEFAGVKNYKLSRPQLFPLESGKTKFFQKYAIVNINDRETPHRNTFGVDWRKVETHLKALGYSVFQVGGVTGQQCGISINTATVGILKHFIAGCDLFIGVDSAPAGIAMAYNKPCVLLFGSVNPDYIHPDLSNTVVIQQPCIYQNCWHSVDGGTSGKPCVFNPSKPPCCISSYEEVIDGINYLVLNKPANI